MFEKQETDVDVVFKLFSFYTQKVMEELRDLDKVNVNRADGKIVRSL